MRNAKKYIQSSPIDNLLTTMVFITGMVLFTAATTVNAEKLDGIAAVVNEDVITHFELRNEINKIKQQLRKQQGKLPDEKALTKQVLERMVLLRIQSQRAELRHIRVDDASLNRAMSNIARENKLRLPELRLALQRDGIEYEAFRENIRTQITVSRLQQREVNNKLVVTEQEIDTFLTNRKIRGSGNEEYRIYHILVSVPEAATAEQIQQSKAEANTLLVRIKGGEEFEQLAIAHSDGQQALTGGDLGWRKIEQLPSMISDVIPSTVAGSSFLVRSPSGFHIIKLSETRTTEKQHIVHQTKARHILVSPTEILSAEQARSRVDQLRQRLVSGEDFSTLAKVHSDDKGSAMQGGDLGWVNPGVMVKPFEEAMNSLEIGELSDAIKTPFGWHLIKVTERRDHDDTNAVQRNRVRELINQRKLEPALENWRRRLRDEAFVQIRI